jgi:peptidoglycan/xylan/chitin deacetylase (PgdA/CDA1 family)
MRGTKDGVIRAVLDTMYWSGIYHAMRPKTAGAGAIFMLHRVQPARAPGAFAPNAALEVTAEFLDATLGLVRRRGLDIVDLDEAVRRLRSGLGGRFAVFTFDDGYADNLDLALPIFERHKAPFTVYVTTGMMDGTADIWWLILEEAIARAGSIRTRIGEQEFSLPAASAGEKQAAWDAIYWPLRDLPIAERQDVVGRLAAEAGVKAGDIFAAVSPGWVRLKQVAANPYLRIGAHTLTHPPLAALNIGAACREIVESKRRIETEIGREVRHFAYPFGDHGSAGTRDFAVAREAGFLSAVTTRRGPLFAEHAQHLHALPRVSLNGHFQALRYVDLFLSGAPFALWNKGRKLDVA